MLAAPLTKKLAATVKLAHYDADGFATDTTKFWFSLDLKL